jgi:hypothetical protein
MGRSVCVGRGGGVVYLHGGDVVVSVQDVCPRVIVRHDKPSPVPLISQDLCQESLGTAGGHPVHAVVYDVRVGQSVGRGCA